MERSIVKIDKVGIEFSDTYVSYKNIVFFNTGFFGEKWVISIAHSSGRITFKTKCKSEHHKLLHALEENTKMRARHDK